MRLDTDVATGPFVKKANKRVASASSSYDQRKVVIGKIETELLEAKNPTKEMSFFAIKNLKRRIFDNKNKLIWHRT